MCCLSVNLTVLQLRTNVLLLVSHSILFCSESKGAALNLRGQWAAAEQRGPAGPLGNWNSGCGYFFFSCGCKCCYLISGEVCSAFDMFRWTIWCRISKPKELQFHIDRSHRRPTHCWNNCTFCLATLLYSHSPTCERDVFIAWLALVCHATRACWWLLQVVHCCFSLADDDVMMHVCG